MTAIETRNRNFFSGPVVEGVLCGDLARSDARTGPYRWILWWDKRAGVDEVAVDEDPATVPSDDRPGGARRRGPVHRRLHSHPALALTTKIVVGFVGTLVTLVGVVMLVTPGPAFVLIPVGLAILATEFEWAHRWLQKARRKAQEARLRAERMDPKTRRRRLLVAVAAVVVLLAAAVAYVVAFGWPSYAVSGWNRLRSVITWVPELPGM